MAGQVCADIVANGGNALADDCDISTWSGAEAMVERCVSAFGGIDGLINNAALFRPCRLTEADEQIWRDTIETNVLGVAFGITHAARRMSARGSGAIVNMTSAAHQGATNLAPYGTSKGAVSSLTYCAALDLGPQGIRVNAVSPFAATRMVEAASQFGAASGHLSTAALPTPEENAAVACYLLSDAAHDFNGLLGAILLTLEEIRVARSDRERAESIDLAGQILMQARDLTGRLLRLARGDETTATSRFDLRDVIDEALAAVKPIFGRRVDVERRFADTAMQLDGSRVEIRQVVTNLLMNAADAMPSGGTVTVSASLERERADASSSASAIAVLSIRDTGSGVPPEVRARLFEPFSTTKRTGRGSGLGLSTALAIAVRHNARLDLADSPHKGAEFVLRIPVASAAPR